LKHNRKEELLIKLFEDWSGESVEGIHSLPLSGSNREYFRITGAKQSAIGVYNPDKKENRAFISFSTFFRSAGLAVPEIYAVNELMDIYLEEDLGDVTLYSYLSERRKTEEFPEDAVSIYKRIVEELIRFQVEGGKDIDYDLCYPRGRFDKQSMLWDMHYFKYYFLKLAQIPFDEQSLEDDFEIFSNYLLQAPGEFFLYRDFQSRNIMLCDGVPHFIDYQGGRKGALQYDLASLLYDAKADMPEHVRLELLNHYINHAGKQLVSNEKEFIDYYYGFVLVRIMQALGAYGFRGFYERKEHFLQSIPYAIGNLKSLLKKIRFPFEIPSLIDALEKLTHSEKLRSLESPKKELVVTINSFSYKKGIPADNSGNGGGFVFDCRALPNPGRLEEFQKLTGKDEGVVRYLEDRPEVEEFLRLTTTLIEQTVENYIDRNFTHLAINFGCTGGQHRSVFAAESLAKHLRERYNIRIELQHREQIQAMFRMSSTETSAPS